MIGSAHLVTALAYALIGVVLLRLAIIIWLTNPVNRVFWFGPYLTPEGLRVVLKAWPLVFLFGAFIASCAIDHTLDYLAGGHSKGGPALEVAAVAEAVISTTTAVIVVILSLRWRP